AICEAGAGVTIRVACPAFPPADAVICVWPTDAAVMTPLAGIDATSGGPEGHVTVPTAIAAPYWSRPDANAVPVCPIWIVAGDSATDTVVSTSFGAVGPPPLHPLKRIPSATR